MAKEKAPKPLSLEWCRSLPGHQQLRREKPISATIWEAVCERIRNFSEGSRNGRPLDASVLDEIRALLGWLTLGAHVPSEAEISQMLGQWDSTLSWMSTEEKARCLTRLAEGMRKRPRGRPTTKRLAAVRALELRQNPKLWPWPKVVSAVCPCGNSGHNEQCSEILQAEVRQLQGVLQRFGIPLPPKNLPSAVKTE